VERSAAEAVDTKRMKAVEDDESVESEGNQLGNTRALTFELTGPRRQVA